MALWTAFLLGLVGSAHCAGMCGPLALALPATGNSRPAFFSGRLCYNLGRLVTYAVLGALFGLVGRSFAVIGLQRWVSLLAGAAILLGLLAAWRTAAAVPMARAVGWLKSRLGKLLRRRALSALFGIGLLNGLLPCGLVYAACAAAATLGSVRGATEYLVAFGLGTVPMMLTISLVGQKLQFALRFKMQRLIPACLALVGVLLLFRGAGLGIPYLSPKISAQSGIAKCCR